MTRWYCDIFFFCEISLWIPNWHGTPQNTVFSRRLIRGLGVSDVGVQVWSSAGGWYQSVGSSVLFHVSRVPWWCGVLQAELLSTWLMTLGDLKSRDISVSYWYCLTIKLSKIFNVGIPILNHPQSRFIIEEMTGILGWCKIITFFYGWFIGCFLAGGCLPRLKTSLFKGGCLSLESEKSHGITQVARYFASCYIKISRT